MDFLSKLVIIEYHEPKNEQKNHEIEASCHFIKLKRDKKSWKDLLITWLGGNVPDFLSKLVINNYLP